MRTRWVALLALLVLSVCANAQRGRAFVSLEAHVGTAHSVHVGFVKHLEPIQYPKQETDFAPGKPYRVRFAVLETIKGKPAKSLDLILALQHTQKLDYVRDHGLEVMLVGTTDDVDEEAEVGLEVPGTRYSFRILQPIRHPKTEPTTAWIADHLNTSMNEGRMFDLNLRVISGRENIVKRARVFASKYPEVLGKGHINIPNEFGVKCGYTNAYCMITLPLCPETKRLALALEQDPSRLLKDVKTEERGVWRKAIRASVRKFLGQFDQKSARGSKPVPTSKNPSQMSIASGVP
ncbi:MAG TPA: hypothetical protein VEX38_10965 [Fimbriimonadaceae bacterium]|nr:hypothetical protein [Fimbriimonadaceae bacterium]